MRALVACLATASLCRTARSQPIECDLDDHCQSGFFCLPEAYVCRKCLNCEQLKREPPLGPPSCIKSVAECGSCFKGLMEDLHGDVTAECVLPDARIDNTLPYKVWIGVGLGLLTFVLIICVVVNVLRNSTFNIRASTRTSVQSPCNRNGNTASAPELPPPYNALYSPVRPSSPPPQDLENPQDDSSWGFVKRAPSTRVREARESAGSQAARVYNNPNYVRGPHLSSNLTPSYDVEGSVVGAEEERDMVVVGHDEDTMESSWTPAGNLLDDNHNGGVSAGAELSTQLAAARTSTLLTTHCATQDSNNNRSGSEPFGGESSTGTSNTVPAVIINVVQNFNAMQNQKQ